MLTSLHGKWTVTRNKRDNTADDPISPPLGETSSFAGWRSCYTALGED